MSVDTRQYAATRNRLRPSWRAFTQPFDALITLTDILINLSRVCEFVLP